MLTEYIQAAMRGAHYEIMENGRYWGDIPALQGVWADSDSLEGCRETLREVLEEWIVVGLRHNHKIPVIECININEPEEAAGFANPQSSWRPRRT